MTALEKGGVVEKPLEGFAPTGPAGHNLFSASAAPRDCPQSRRGPVGQEEVLNVKLRSAIVPGVYSLIPPVYPSEAWQTLERNIFPHSHPSENSVPAFREGAPSANNLIASEAALHERPGIAVYRLREGGCEPRRARQRFAASV
jgi:hypothetical protein